MYIFDLDGTITDTNGLWVEVDDEFLARRGLRATPEYTDTVARSIYPIAAQFTRDYYRLPDPPEAIMAEWDSLAERHYRELAPLKPGAAEFLRQCHGEGYPWPCLPPAVPRCAGPRWSVSACGSCSATSSLRRRSAWKSETPRVLFV